jgi:hypothetical protein
MRTGTLAQRGTYKQCANPKCKAMFYVPPKQNLRSCSMECRLIVGHAPRTAQDGHGDEKTKRPQGPKKVGFDDSALTAIMQPNLPPKIGRMEVSLRKRFPED